MPDGLTVAGATESILSDEQKARGQALLIARDLLAQKGSGPFSSVSLNGSTTGDLIAVAEYILRGQLGGCIDCGSDESEPDWDNQDAPYPTHRGAILFGPGEKGYVIHGTVSHADVENFIESRKAEVVAAAFTIDDGEHSSHLGWIARARAILGNHQITGRQADEVLAALNTSGVIR